MPQCLYFIVNDTPCRICSEKCFIYWIYHWRQPAQTVLTDEDRFGYDGTYLRKMFMAMNKWNHETHGHRLQNLGFCAHHFSEFNKAIVNKIKQLGEVVPEAAILTSFFADCSRFLTTIPSGGW